LKRRWRGQVGGFTSDYAEAIAAINLCLVPTVHLERLFAFIIIGHDDDSWCGLR